MRHVVLALACVVALAQPALAQQRQQGGQAPQTQQPAAQRPATPEPRRPDAITRHTVQLASGPFAYVATVGSLPVADQNGEVRANFVYTSYVKADGGTGRPLTFAFNGGPGIASAYLHLGALGPRMMVVNDDGTMPMPPAALAGNPLSWLAFTDLVFVDPVGTGFSRPVSSEGRQTPNSDFWGVDQDVTWAARFVRTYITSAKRWESPKFLVGESYGGFRVARLSNTLQDQFGIQLNGAMLISPLLEYGLNFGEERAALWPAVLRLPSLAAVAYSYGRVADAPRDRDAFLSEVEKFALTEMLPGLAQGQGLSADRRAALYRQIARYSGLPLEQVQRADGRPGRETFIKEVLRHEGKVVGRYDASVNFIDQAPGSQFFNDPDPTYQGVAQPLLSAINTYLAGELQVSDDRPYVLTNTAANGQWDWRTQRREGNSVGSLSQLRSAMVGNAGLRVLVAHGRYDLITPYFVSAYAIGQMQLEPDRRRNIEFRLYDGGHMMYLHKATRERLFADAEAFYAAAAPGRE